MTLNLFSKKEEAQERKLNLQESAPCAKENAD